MKSDTAAWVLQLQEVCPSDQAPLRGGGGGGHEERTDVSLSSGHSRSRAASLGDRVQP